ncbi:MAG: DUF1800 domain-containing protein [Cyclobacteriaceae bacterium]|nr:DUF1800 domain-containing protein [Cyclobacteriaceae bacterium]
MSIIIPQPRVKHLMNRAAFGLSINRPAIDLADLNKESQKVSLLNSVPKPEIDAGDLQSMKDKATRKEMVKELFSKSRQELMKLNVDWVDKIIADPSLREKMTFFWHGHFACRTLVPYFAQQQNNILRTSALGSFREMLMGISKDPAMLQFLNNQQNRKDHPNENFAREVMELFTLGRGNYTETDVKEAARAFTGWAFNVQGEFQFRQKQHDFSSKTFRGTTRNFTGEDILESILEDRKTASFITNKLYRYFISDQNAPGKIADEWSESFYKSDYNIQKLLQTMLQSDEFNNATHIGNRIKSPIDLIISLLLHTGGKFENDQSIIFLERALGQILFYPPNVSGWTSGKGWIDSTSLTFRVSLPMLLFGGSETDFEAADDGDANGLGKEATKKRRLQCNVDWTNLANQFTKSSATETLETIQSFLLARPTTSTNQSNIARLAGSTHGDAEFVKKAFIGFMSVPEYQLC